MIILIYQENSLIVSSNSDCNQMNILRPKINFTNIEIEITLEPTGNNNIIKILVKKFENVGDLVENCSV